MIKLHRILTHFMNLRIFDSKVNQAIYLEFSAIGLFDKFLSKKNSDYLLYYKSTCMKVKKMAKKIKRKYLKIGIILEQGLDYRYALALRNSSQKIIMYFSSFRRIKIVVDALDRILPKSESVSNLDSYLDKIDRRFVYLIKIFNFRHNSFEMTLYTVYR